MRLRAAARAALQRRELPIVELQLTCLSCDELRVDSGEGRFCAACSDHEGTCVNDHCLTCGAPT